MQLSDIYDNDTVKRIEDKLTKLEEELRKPKPKWGTIIAGVFVLFGFFADLKTINPTIYDTPYQTVNQIISTIHIDGLVQKSMPMLPFANDKKNEEEQSGDLASKDMILPKREDEEI